MWFYIQLYLAIGFTLGVACVIRAIFNINAAFKQAGWKLTFYILSALLFICTFTWPYQIFMMIGEILEYLEDRYIK